MLLLSPPHSPPHTFFIQLIYGIDMEYGGMAEGTREDKRIEMAAHFPSIHGGRSFKKSSAYTRLNSQRFIDECTV